MGERGGPGAGVVDLRAEHEVGLAVDDEGVAVVFFGDAGRRCVLSMDDGGAKGEGQKEREEL